MTEQNRFLETRYIRRFNTGQYIFHQGTPGDVMYIIRSGKVGVYINSVNEIPIKISEIGAGDFFGEMSLLEDMPRNASIMAETETVVLAITKENFISFICEEPSMAFKIMKGLSSRIRDLDNELKKYIQMEKNSKLTEAPSLNNSGNSENTNHTKIREPEGNLPENHSTDQQTYLQDDLLFPSGHKTYAVPMPESYKDFLFVKQISCPVCEGYFEAKRPSNSKVKVEKTDYDFRQRCVDFEPLWFNIWVCPRCYYANSHQDFNNIPNSALKPLRGKLEELRKQITLKFVESLDIDQVFTAYYLALFSAKVFNASPLKFAKLWLQLSWLYKDVDDQEMFKMASSFALDNYYNAMYHTYLELTVEQEQQCYLLLGELFLIKGDEKEALKHFHTALKKTCGKEFFTQQAQNRINDIRDKQ